MVILTVVAVGLPLIVHGLEGMKFFDFFLVHGFVLVELVRSLPLTSGWILLRLDVSFLFFCDSLAFQVSAVFGIVGTAFAVVMLRLAERGLQIRLLLNYE